MHLISLYRAHLRREYSEDGFALPSVIAIVAILVILGVVVVGASVSAAGFATSTRSDVQSNAAANAGIDAVRAKMLGGQFPCALSSNVSPQFSATVSYRDSAGNALSCPSGGVVSGTPASATVMSTGTADAKGVAGVSAKDKSKIGANLAVQITPGGYSLTEALFSNGDLTLTNGDNIDDSSDGALDADIYSNGSVACPANGSIEGTIYSQGGLNFQNSNCVAFGTIWLNGNLDVASVSAVFKGSIFSTGTVNVGNSPVSGAIIANGNVTLGQPNASCTPGGTQANVCGSVYSLNGSVSFYNGGSKVLGSLYSRGALVGGQNPNQGTSIGGDLVSLGGGISNYFTVGGNVSSGAGADSSKITRVVTAGHQGALCSSDNTVCTADRLVLPAPISASPPFAVQLPMFSVANPTNLGTPTTTVSVVAPPKQYMPQVAPGISSWISSGWTPYVADTSWCNLNGGDFTTKLSDVFANYSGANVVIDLSACTAGGAVITGGGSATVTLSGTTVSNVAFVVPGGFGGSNLPDLTVTTTDNHPHTAYFVAPSNSPGVSWGGAQNATPTCTNGPNIQFNHLNTSQSAQVFVYTPCAALLQNSSVITGQFYSGTSSYPSGMTVTMPTPGNLAVVPGMSVPGGGSSAASYSADVTSRFNVTG